jgi:acyl-coenzyme A thioesterase PaaI-like protein
MNSSTLTISGAHTGTPGLNGEQTQHERCWVCGASRADGLRLKFSKDADGTVLTEFGCPERYAGYPGVLHGGMVTTLLDAAMTHCLFALHEVAMTADLHVRFRAPVRVNTTATIRAWQVRTRGAMEEVCAELWQEGELRVSARGKFIRTRIPGQGNVYHLNPQPSVQANLSKQHP